MRSSRAPAENAFEAVRRKSLALLERLDHGEIAPVYVFCGPDDFQRETMLRRALAKLLPAEFRDTSLSTFDGGQTSARQVAAELEATGFRFDDSPRRVVVVRDCGYFGKAEESEILAARLDSGLMGDVCLVLEVRGNMDKRTKLAKLVEAKGEVLEFPALANENDALTLLSARARRAGKYLGRAAVGLLVERCGLDAQRLAHEVDKLTAYLGDRDEIETDDVRQMVAATAELSVFDLVDAVAERKPRQALDQLDRLLAQNADPFMILAMLIRQVRLLLQARWLLETDLVEGKLLRMRPFEFNTAINDQRSGDSPLARWRAASVGILPADGKQALLKQHYFPLQKSLQLAQRFRLEALEAAMERLLQADLGIKTSHLEPEQEIEQLVADLCTRIGHGATVDFDALLEP